MSGLKDRLRGDLTASMKARDEVRTRTLRMALTEIAKEEVSGAAPRELDDAEISGVIAREAKRRREAADAFGDAGRADQARRNAPKAEVLAEYLPAQIGDAELTAIVPGSDRRNRRAGLAAMGQVMKTVTPAVAGRAEGARVAAEVRRQLAAD